MKNKTFTYECNCIHCKQKLNQINNAKLYWDKLMLRKTFLFSKISMIYKKNNLLTLAIKEEIWFL